MGSAVFPKNKKTIAWNLDAVTAELRKTESSEKNRRTSLEKLLHLMTLIFPCPLPAQKSYLVFVSPAGIGPPSSVKLTLAGYSLEVSIVDPLTSTNSSMKDYMADLSYNIRYWERHEDEEVWNTC